MITIRKILRNKKSQTMSSTSWGNNCHRSLVDKLRTKNYDPILTFEQMFYIFMLLLPLFCSERKISAFACYYNAKRYEVKNHSKLVEW